MHKENACGLRRFLSSLLLGLFVITSLAPRFVLKAEADYSEGESFYNQKYELPGLNTVHYQASSWGKTSTGAFVYSYPIFVPPGRNGLEPSLQLTYNSQNRQQGSWVGLGWSLEIPSITRLNKTGVDKMYEDQYFTSTLDGELVATSLSDEVHGDYVAKIEQGQYNLYEYHSSGYWTVIDKSGTVYTFGTNTDTRLDNSDDTTQVFQWMLEEVRDTNDNYVTYGYSKDNGKIYPETITYTGNGSTDGPFTVEFSLESRDDSFYSYSSGFEILVQKRLASITTYKEGTWLRTYELDYEAGTNGNTSLLASITESGQSEDGTTVTRPAIEFDYSDSPSWTTASGSYSQVQNFFSEKSGSSFTHDDGGRLIDLNGDSLPDFVYSVVSSDYSETSSAVYLTKTGGGVEQDSSYVIPVGFIKQDTYEDQGVNFADVDGDGLIDFLKNDPWDLASDNGVYINQGDGTWSLDTLYSIPLHFIDRSTLSGQVRDYGTRVFDVNGDGLVDIVYAMEIGSTTSYTVEVDSLVYINKADGTGWELDSNYELPVGFIDYDTTNGGADRGVRILDLNGDGLLDFVKDYGSNDSSSACVLATYCIQNGYFINQGDGTGWESIAYGSALPGTFISENSNSIPEDYGARLIDINADGLADMVTSIEYDSTTSFSDVQLLTGGYLNWNEDTSFSIPIPFVQGDWVGDYGARFDDLNGDGVTDFILSGIESEFYWSESGLSEMLESIAFSQGGSMSIEYKGSGEYSSQETSASDYELQNEMPFVVQTVYQITTEDGLGDSSTVTYDYSGGFYYYEDELNRQFAGFSSITKMEEGRVSETFYEQDEFPLLGHAYQTDVYDGSGNLYSRTVDTWATSDLGYDNDFVYKTQSVSMSYDGDSSGGSGTHRDTGSAYTYDSNGNVSTVINYGEVTASADGTFTDVTEVDEKYTVTYSYATDTSGSEIRGKVKQEVFTDSSGSTLKKTRYFYDSLAYGSVSTGNLTRDARYYDVSNLWYSIYYTYNTYGLIASVRNPRNYTTSFTYDSYYLYPSVTTNPKSYTVSMEYDLATGQVTSRTDENNITSETSYDGLGRILTVSLPDPTSGVLTTLSTTSYDDTSVPSSATTTSTVNGVSSENVSYFDGLGRTVQTNTLAEDSVYNTTDTFYDDLGNVYQQTLPYETSSAGFGRDDSQYSVSSTYDALNRPLAITDPNGTTTYSYSQWENTVTDANGISKVYSYGSAGQLLTVEEQDDSSGTAQTFTTAYEYDPLGELTTLTDAQGNERSFDYDSLGRKITQTDLHDPTETSYGTWTYTYDKNNNLLTQTDPAGQKITWAYDSLDRPSYEDWDTSTTARNAAYTYDTATRGKMRLYQMKVGTSSDYIDRFQTYDYLGNPTKETRFYMKPGLTTYYSYIFQTTSDLLSRPTKLIYPSSVLTINYAYNETGALENVVRGTSVTNYSDVVSDFDYSPMGQLESITFGNGVTTTNTFSAAQAYRLTNKTTAGVYDDGTTSTSGSVQSLEYTYDSVGNITGIVDSSITPTAKTLAYSYDDLNRLLSASSSGLTASSDARGDYSETYEYDEVGNLTYKSNVGDLLYEGTGSSGGSYSGANPHAVTSVAGTAYTYDSNGNLTNSSAHLYSWDKRNRLSSSGSKTFYYDGGGGRYKTADSSSGSDEYTYYVSPYLEYHDGTSSSAGTPTYYIFAGGQRIASYEDTDGDGTKEYYYYHQDHLGGTALVTDDIGTVSQLYDYYPYGSELLNEQPTSGNAPSEHSFTDKELDDDLGLYYFEARWYDSEIGRFSSQDPAQLERVEYLLTDPQQLNYYAYSRNNPVNLVDPTGQEADEPNWFQKTVEFIGDVLDIIPGTGDVSDAYGAVFGETLFAQDDLSTGERILGAVATLLPLTAGQIKTGAKVLDAAGDILKQSDNIKFTYGDKIRGQIKNRGWDGNSVQETLNNPYKTVETTDYRYNQDGSRMDDPATAYVNEDGSYVVRNNNSGDIVQISNKNDPDWKSSFE